MRFPYGEAAPPHDRRQRFRDEAHIAHGAEPPSDHGLARPVGAGEDANQDPLADASLDALVGRTQPSLEQIYDGRELQLGGSSEQVGHDAHGA